MRAHVLTLAFALSLPAAAEEAPVPASVERPPPPVVKPPRPKKTRFAQRRLSRPSPGEGTPLVWSRTERLSLRHDARTFELEPGVPLQCAWPGPEAAWLVQGESVESGRQLFGSFSVSGGRRAVNGFEALSWLDADGDGAVTPADPGHASLRLWFDRNSDRAAQADELEPLGSMSLPLAYEVVPACDGSGNCVRERVPAGGGWLLDLHLRLEPHGW